MTVLSMNQTSLPARSSEEHWIGFLAALGTLITTVTHGVGGGRQGPEGSEALKHRPRSGLAMTSLRRAAGQQPGGDACLWRSKAQRSGRQTGHEDAKPAEIGFCTSTLLSSLSRRHLNVFRSCFLMNGEVPHGIKWLPGALSPLCVPVLAGARRFWQPANVQSAFLHEVGLDARRTKSTFTSCWWL